jgi:CheY-like chemotaxis protein
MNKIHPILLVEDNPMDIDLSLQAFGKHGIVNPIEVCQDGEEALAYIRDHPSADSTGLPVVVLLEQRLPKVDGLEVLRQAREHPVWKQVPFVVLTTSRESEDVETAYSLGVNSYIVKPVNFESFNKVIQNIKVYWLLTNEPPFNNMRTCAGQ